MFHSQFKVFNGSLESFDAIKGEIETFVAHHKISARSIGIEFIEHNKEILVSLGYSKGDHHAPISITPVNFGKVNLHDKADLEKKMTEAAEKQKNVICHELFVTDKDELLMVFMSHKN